jgi:hypothetical protein
VAVERERYRPEIAGADPRKCDTRNKTPPSFVLVIIILLSPSKDLTFPSKYGNSHVDKRLHNALPFNLSRHDDFAVLHMKGLSSSES